MASKRSNSISKRRSTRDSGLKDRAAGSKRTSEDRAQLKSQLRRTAQHYIDLMEED